MITPLFTEQSFRNTIEKLVVQEGHSYTESIILVCDEHGIEYADIVPLIPAPMIVKIEAEARSKNILPRINTLAQFI